MSDETHHFTIEGSLSPLERDALQELGSIGAAHAATALAQMLGKRVDISVPTADIVKLDKVSTLVGGDDQLVASVCLELLGDARGVIAVLLPRPTALALADVLMGQEPGSSSVLTEVGKSALLELGNIITGAYLTALSNLLGIFLLASVPSLHFDMAGPLAKAIMQKLQDGRGHAFVIYTEFRTASASLSGHFLLAPDTLTIQTVVQAIHRLLGDRR